VPGRGPVTKKQLSACLPPVLAPDVLLVTDRINEKSLMDV